MYINIYIKKDNVNYNLAKINVGYTNDRLVMSETQYTAIKQMAKKVVNGSTTFYSDANVKVYIEDVGAVINPL